MLFRSKTTGLALNCRKEERDGVVIVRCAPIEKREDIRQELGERETVFKVMNGKLELIDDGGVPKHIMKELDDYLRRML